MNMNNNNNSDKDDYGRDGYYDDDRVNDDNDKHPGAGAGKTSTQGRREEGRGLQDTLKLQQWPGLLLQVQLLQA